MVIKDKVMMNQGIAALIMKLFLTGRCIVTGHLHCVVVFLFLLEYAALANSLQKDRNDDSPI